MKKRIVLCADDYGQASPISEGILTLIKNGRLSATSCMVNSTFWLAQAPWLKPYRAKIDIGLHFNLTEGRAVSKQYQAKYGENLFTLPVLMRRVCLRQLDGAVIEAECHAQIDRFIEGLGHLPGYLDGHQHSHQFPIIREAVLRVYEARLRSSQAYIRLVNEKIKPSDMLNIKKIIIYLMGTAAIKRALDRQHIPHNHSFAGIYSFNCGVSYGSLFSNFLSRIKDGGLIMCHPGLASSGGQDAIARARYEEFQYLASDQFIEDCRVQKVSIERFIDRPESG